MPIDLTCGTCGEQFQLKDEFAGRKVKCRSCQSVLEVPDANLVDLEVETQIVERGYPPQFNRDKFFVNQKKISIGENYFIYNEDKQPILFVRRPAHIFRFLLAIAGAVVTAFVVIIGAIALAGALAKPGQDQTLSRIIAIVGVVAAIVLAVLVAIRLSPKRHITFYEDKSKEAREYPLLKIDQDQKVAFPKATYTVRTPDEAGARVDDEELFVQFLS